MSKPEASTCPYCGQPAVLHPDSRPYYRGRDYGPLWVCDPCSAWVGCHPGTMKPLGLPSNFDLRRARARAHDAFDPLWGHLVNSGLCTKQKARMRVYGWLARLLGIDPADCHIGQMDAETCARVVALCDPYILNLKVKDNAARV